MSLPVYILCLVAGGLVAGALVGLLVPRTSSEGMVPPIVLGGVAAVVVGLVAGFFMLAEGGRLTIVGLAVAFVLAALYVALSGLSDKAAGYWWGGGGGGGNGGNGGG